MVRLPTQLNGMLIISSRGNRWEREQVNADSAILNAFPHLLVNRFFLSASATGKEFSLLRNFANSISVLEK